MCCACGGGDTSGGDGGDSDGGDDTSDPTEVIFNQCDTSMDGKLELGEFKTCYDEACAMDVTTDPNAPCVGYTAEEVFACYDTTEDTAGTSAVATLCLDEFKAIGEAIDAGTFMNGCESGDDGDSDGGDNTDPV